MSNVLLEVKNMSVLIKDRFLVKNVFFKMNEGECWAIIGEDKSGKTSLIKAISGSLPISAGQVFLEGHDIFYDKKILTKVSTCFDPPIFFKYQTVMENMQYISMLSEANNKNEILKALKKFDLESKANTKVRKLTYFEKKLMGLALGFLTKPRLLLLDEPFKNLPPEKLKVVQDAIEKIRMNGTSVIFTSKNLEDIQFVCDKYLFMENRAVKKIMSREEIENVEEGPTYSFVKVKYPHYVGKLIMENFGLNVKILDRRVLFEADEAVTSKIIQFLSVKKLSVYSAGLLSKKAENIFASLTPYFKPEPAETEVDT